MSFYINSMNDIRKGFASIEQFKLSGPTVVPIELCDVFRNQLGRSLIPVDFPNLIRGLVIRIDTLNNLRYAFNTFREYSLNRKIKNSAGSLLIISVSFSLSFLFNSPGRHTVDKAFNIIFLLDCFVKVCFRYFGSILGYWANLW